MKMYRLSLSALLLAHLVLTHASAQPNPSDSVTEIKSQTTQVTAEPISVEESLSMRDPFRRPAKFAAPGNDLALPDLERYGSDQIKVVGIITGPKKPKALVVTPNNKMFIVSENDRIGVHKGIITKIKEKSILVKEKIVNLVGQEESTNTEIFYTTKKPNDSATTQ